MQSVQFYFPLNLGQFSRSYFADKAEKYTSYNNLKIITEYGNNGEEKSKSRTQRYSVVDQDLYSGK